MHWNLSDSPPQWCKNTWDGIGPVPSHDKPGCYALIRGEDSVVYIGSAISRGAGRYKDFGLSSRINRYIKRDRDKRRADRQPVYKFQFGYTGIYTIGFPRDRAYLAIALEQYLIARFGAELINKKRVSYEETQPFATSEASPVSPPS